MRGAGEISDDKANFMQDIKEAVEELKLVIEGKLEATNDVIVADRHPSPLSGEGSPEVQ